MDDIIHDPQATRMLFVEGRIGLIAALMDTPELLPLIMPASRQCNARAPPHLLVWSG
jgi:hypothetical protein